MQIWPFIRNITYGDTTQNCRDAVSSLKRKICLHPTKCHSSEARAKFFRYFGNGLRSQSITKVEIGRIIS